MARKVTERIERLPNNVIWVRLPSIENKRAFTDTLKQTDRLLKEPQYLVLDFKEVVQADSTIFRYALEFFGSHKKTYVINLKEQPYTVFKLLQLDKIFIVVGGLNEAVMEAVVEMTHEH